MSTTFPTQAISQQANSTTYPIYPPNGGFITVDTPTRELFYQIMCGTAGSIIIQSKNGVNRYYPQFNAGVLYPAAGVKVVSAAVIDGQSVTTTASNIWWYGGM